MGTADIVSHGITFGADAGQSVEVEHVMADVLFVGNKTTPMNRRGRRLVRTSEAQ